MPAEQIIITPPRTSLAPSTAELTFAHASGVAVPHCNLLQPSRRPRRILMRLTHSIQATRCAYQPLQRAARCALLSPIPPFCFKSGHTCSRVQSTTPTQHRHPHAASRHALGPGEYSKSRRPGTIRRRLATHRPAEPGLSEGSGLVCPPWSCPSAFTRSNGQTKAVSWSCLRGILPAASCDTLPILRWRRHGPCPRARARPAPRKMTGKHQRLVGPACVGCGFRRWSGWFAAILWVRSRSRTCDSRVKNSMLLPTELSAKPPTFSNLWRNTFREFPDRVVQRRQRGERSISEERASDG